MEIIEFRPPKVFVAKLVLTDTPHIVSTTTGADKSLVTTLKHGDTLKTLPKATTRKRPREKKGPCSDDENPDFNKLEESGTDDADFVDPTCKKRKGVHRALADKKFKFKCSVCPNTRFSKESEYKWHMTHVHGDVSKKYQIFTCPLCKR